jgi:hypothetical protein
VSRFSVGKSGGERYGDHFRSLTAVGSWASLLSSGNLSVLIGQWVARGSETVL